MIKDIKKWQEFEKNLIKNSKPDYQKNLIIFKQMLDEAVILKAFPPKDLLFGIDAKIRMAKILKKIK